MTRALFIWEEGMSPEEIERAIAKIAWGGRFIQAKTIDKNIVPVIIKSLTIRERNFIEFVYESAFEEAREAGVLPKFELYNLYKKRGLWTTEDEELFESITVKINEASERLSKTQKRARIVLQKKIESLEKRREVVSEKRKSLFAVSCEAYAEEMKTLAMVFCSVHDEKENKIWNTWADFLNSRDNMFVMSILANFNTNFKVFTVSQIREIARSHAWRFRWAGAKSADALFNTPTTEYNVEQQSLLYWSQVYDSVYESMDRPPQSVIDDDEALDKWFEDQNRKDKQKRLERGGDVGEVRMSDKMRGHGEVFIVANPVINPNAPTIEEIDELNTELVRKFKQKEAEEIKKHGMLKETELRKRGDRVARKIIGASDAVIKGNSFGQASGGKKAGTILPGGSIT